jgi:hypothetical protein
MAELQNLRNLSTAIEQQKSNKGAQTRLTAMMEIACRHF